jgi:hypothetical protein
MNNITKAIVATTQPQRIAISFQFVDLLMRYITLIKMSLLQTSISGLPCSHGNIVLPYSLNMR